MKNDAVAVETNLNNRHEAMHAKFREHAGEITG
jgi:hypothetical protein